MASMMFIAYLASTEPDSSFYLQPELTNRQFFRLMASHTYSFFMYPYISDYHYWSGDFSGLYYVDENWLLNLTLTGGAAPHTPKYLDQYNQGHGSLLIDHNSPELWTLINKWIKDNKNLKKKSK
ncbi:hypothetical protein [Methanosarcina horonobensis]|nr:hypothetical protein [Methanosarcina horonobensis]